MGHTFIDLYAFCITRRGYGAAGHEPLHGELSGQEPLASFTRLLTDLPEQHQGNQQVEWSLRGLTTSAGKRFVDVHAQADVTLECQRCLQPFVLSVQVDNRLEIVRDPAQLDGDEDDEIERIVGSKRFDVEDFIEDELILSLPAVPKHVVCSSVADQADADLPDDKPARPSPFAALERLKKK